MVGLNRSTDSEDWGILLRITDSDQVVHEWPMPASLLAGRGDEMRAELLGLGLQISPTKTARDRLSEYIQTWRTDLRYRCVDRLGWHDDTFVLPRQVFGPETFGDEVLFQHQHARDIPKFEQAGTMDGWRAEVAAPALGNDRLILALATAFAGPLVRLIGEESGGLHLFGPSSTGKTTALRCACSVWGIRHASWRASDNALEPVAAAACDGFLPLDETGQAAPRVLAAAAYMLAAQMGKARMSRAGNRNRATLRWTLLFLSTGELPLTATLAAAGIPAQAGQQVRMIELPADAGAGLGLFQELHGSADPDAFARRLRDASERHCGHAAPLFLEHLVADRAAAVAMVRATMEKWLLRHLARGAAGQVSRVASRFALIAAAGELASVWGILPWPGRHRQRGGGRVLPGVARAPRRNRSGRDPRGPRPGAGVPRGAWIEPVRSSVGDSTGRPDHSRDQSRGLPPARRGDRGRADRHQDLWPVGVPGAARGMAAGGLQGVRLQGHRPGACCPRRSRSGRRSQPPLQRAGARARSAPPDARSPLCLQRKRVGTVGAVRTTRQTASFRRSDREHRSRISRNPGRNWPGPFRLLRQCLGRSERRKV